MAVDKSTRILAEITEVLNAVQF